MGTVTKALSLLQFFSVNRASIGLSEMARLSGLHKPTVHRLLAELCAAGFVEQHGIERNYRLGTEVLRLAKLREAAVPLVTLGRSQLDWLSEETGETTHMSVLQGERLIEIAHVYSPSHATRVVMDDAEVLSFNGTSSGLAVLSYLDDETAEGLLAAPLPAHTDLTLTDPAALRRVMVEVRQSGVARSLGGFERDVFSHAAPYFDGQGRPMGALAVAAPITRMDETQSGRIAALVHGAALELTRQTGGQPPASYPVTFQLPADA